VAVCLTGDAVSFVPLTDVAPQDGLASVVVASLEDAGFHPLLDCDPRGWMHYYEWPRGAFGLLTIWIPAEERADAAAFLAAASELPAEPGPEPSRFSLAFSAGRRFVYTGWLFGAFLGISGLLAPLAGLFALTETEPPEPLDPDDDHF
jgi:hypothetical protein